MTKRQVGGGGVARHDALLVGAKGYSGDVRHVRVHSAAVCSNAPVHIQPPSCEAQCRSGFAGAGTAHAHACGCTCTCPLPARLHLLLRTCAYALTFPRVRVCAHTDSTRPQNDRTYLPPSASEGCGCVLMCVFNSLQLRDHARAGYGKQLSGRSAYLAPWRAWGRRRHAASCCMAPPAVARRCWHAQWRVRPGSTSWPSR